MLRILDDAIVSEREHQDQAKWQKADKRHLDRFQKNAPVKPAAPAPQDTSGKGKGGKGDGQEGKDKSKSESPAAGKGNGNGLGGRQLFVYFIYAKFTAKECTYVHARPETAEEKAHYKGLYKIFGRKEVAITDRQQSAPIHHPRPPRRRRLLTQRGSLRGRSAVSIGSALSRESPTRRPPPRAAVNPRD